MQLLVCKKAKVSIAQTDKARTQPQSYTEKHVHQQKNADRNTFLQHEGSNHKWNFSSIFLSSALEQYGSVLGCKANLGQTKLALHYVFYSCTDLLKMVYFKTLPYFEIYILLFQH